MVTVEIRHRLGNNLFQIAAAYALAKTTHDTLHLHRWQYSDRFKIPSQPLVKADWKTWAEPSFAYHKIEKYPNTYLQGYFQSEKYFQDCADDIREMFGPPIPMPGCVAVHVRRGDYVNNPHYFDLLTTDYYAREIANFPAYEIVFFSDDIQFCMKFFSGMKIDCVFSNEPDPVTDMRKIAGCDYIIGSNSTFAWWGAWLAGHDRVTMPRNWFAGPSLHLDTKDLIPERWTTR